MSRWLRRLYLRTCSVRQLREERAELMLTKAGLLSHSVRGDRVRPLLPIERLLVERVDARILDVDVELHRRGL